jgi:hypothetical protein
MKKATVKITFDEDVDVVDALYHISMLQKYKNALFEITHNLWGRVKHFDDVSVDHLLAEISEIIEEEGIDINRLDS